MQVVWKVVFLIAAQAFGICNSQEKPRYTFPKFSNETVRQSFCDVHRLVESGQIERKDALRGMELRPLLFPYNLNAESAIDVVPHIAIEFLDELARRAGFRWRDSYGLAKSPEDDETWRELLLWAGSAYDLVGEWFLKTEERVARGVHFGDGWWDAGLIMVKKSEEEANLDFFNFLNPFTYGLWILIGVTLLVTGVIYYLLDYLDSRRHDKEMDLDFNGSMFNAAWIFTGHSLHEPKSTATRFLVFSLSFLCLLLVASYTANLVSFLVTEKTDKMQINDVSDLVKHDLKCCVQLNSVYHDLMIKNYPTVKLVPVPDKAWGQEIFHALGRSECDVLLTDAQTFKIRERSAEFNPHCNLKWVGRKIYDEIGDFPVMDSVNLCTSLLSDVLSYHMLQMKNDKTHLNIWEKYILRSETGFCSKAKEESEDADKLGLSNMLGIFVLYFGVMLCTVLWSLCQCYRAGLNKKRRLSLVQNIQSTIREAVPMSSLTLEAPTASNVVPVQESTLAAMAQSGMAVDIGQDNLSSNRPGIELMDTESSPPLSKEHQESMNWQVQAFWDKLTEIEKDRDELRERLEKDRNDLHEMFERDRHELRELLERDRQDQMQKDKQSRKRLRYLKSLIETQGQQVEKSEDERNGLKCSSWHNKHE